MTLGRSLHPTGSHWLYLLSEGLDELSSEPPTIADVIIKAPSSGTEMSDGNNHRSLCCGKILQLRDGISELLSPSQQAHYRPLTVISEAAGKLSVPFLNALCPPTDAGHSFRLEQKFYFLN